MAQLRLSRELLLSGINGRSQTFFAGLVVGEFRGHVVWKKLQRFCGCAIRRREMENN